MIREPKTGGDNRGMTIPFAKVGDISHPIWRPCKHIIYIYLYIDSLLIRKITSNISIPLSTYKITKTEISKRATIFMSGTRHF